ncbi:uncharacterized protein [Temnothorax nylanderi]|uniref:uncharacterized protein isoform X2 n=1 Tax=Temnothorax nylanderi TaxID=102681 RepID=UPI003A86938D
MASDIEVQADLSDSGNDEYNETDKSKNKSKSGQSLLEPLKDITGKFCRHSFVNKRARSSTELSTSNKSCNGITWETNSDTYQYTIELQTKMLYKINNIELQNETIMARLTAMERDSHVKIPQSQLHFSEELSKLFPIKKFENLTDLEIRLNNKSFFSQVKQHSFLIQALPTRKLYISSISKWLDSSKTRLSKERLQTKSAVTLNMEFDENDEEEDTLA